MSRTIDLASTGEDPDEYFAAKSVYSTPHLDHYGLGELLGGGPELTDHQLQVRSSRSHERYQDPVWTYRQAAAGHSEEVYRFGIERSRWGWNASSRGGAEPAFRGAAENGHVKAMQALGFLLAERGDVGEAEFWLRKAADAEDNWAMPGLVELLFERGEAGEAEARLRKAADNGSSDSMYRLSKALFERGEADEARSWLQKAADNGCSDAIFQLIAMILRPGIELAEHGEIDEVESWLRKATDAGPHNAADAFQPFASGLHYRPRIRHHPDAADAMYRLGAILAERGEFERAESWLRKAGKIGNFAAEQRLYVMFFDHAVLLAERGETREAESWFRRTVTDWHGNVDSMYRLGVLLSERGEIFVAKAWLGKAADAGHREAMSKLKALRAERQAKRRIWRRSS